MDLNYIVEKLSNADFEEAKDIAQEELKKYVDIVERRNGYIVGYNKSQKIAKKVILDAHIDQIGFIVRYITDDGFIKVAALGGIDARILPAQEVIIYGKKKTNGVFTSIPPHFQRDSGKNAVILDDLSIDCGFLNKDEALENINLGDLVAFNTKFTRLTNNTVTGKALDDRAGIAAILLALEKSNMHNNQLEPIIVFSDNEEVGERGACIAAKQLEADYAVAVDVSFAYANGEKKEKCGTMGDGVMIGIAPSLDRGLYNLYKKYANKENINYQTEAMPGLTSTNADQYSAMGIPSITLSIPLKYMHTPVEIVQINDIIAVSDIISVFLRGEIDE